MHVWPPLHGTSAWNGWNAYRTGVFTAPPKVASRFSPDDVITLSPAAILVVAQRWMCMRQTPVPLQAALRLQKTDGSQSGPRCADLWNDSATLASARLFHQHFCHQSPGSRRPDSTIRRVLRRSLSPLGDQCRRNGAGYDGEH